MCDNRIGVFSSLMSWADMELDFVAFLSTFDARIIASVTV